jgi:1,4-alpha-glucan branching enzyme
MHRDDDRWVFREWAPNAERVFLIGDFSKWQELAEFEMNRIDNQGNWELSMPASTLVHGMFYKLKLYWPGGSGERLPAYVRRAVQDLNTHHFTAQIWEPESKFTFRHKAPQVAEPIIYEAHVGMASEKCEVGSFTNFTENVLPYIASCGYNTVQLMAILEHPYYGSFGYHVSNFFAVSSRFGTPEEFKALVDEAHKLGLRIIVDIVHSHSVKNEYEGLGRFDGTNFQYFHQGQRGNHWLWDSYCFDYSKPQVLHFLLSNCKYWLEEYNIDGFRFDGVTSMLYYHHGLGKAFTSYDDYFGDEVDEDAYCYLALANKLIHQYRRDAISVAEDVSGMPGLCAPYREGGAGFDYRMAMGVTDRWFKLMDIPDECWEMHELLHELMNKRPEEKTISYLECHDQALVGGKSAIFTLIDKEMYYSMNRGCNNMTVDRGIALHKIMRIATMFTAANGYLNFMGNEFGHPEWIDFPREGNNWSYHYARRLWTLKDDASLRYRDLLLFDNAAIKTVSDSEFYKYPPMELACDNNDKVFAVKRGEKLLVVNLHPYNSYEGYGIETLPGDYRIALDSDSPEFGGFDRIDSTSLYSTIPTPCGETIKDYLKLYLPARTAIVLDRVRR